MGTRVGCRVGLRVGCRVGDWVVGRRVVGGWVVGCRVGICVGVLVGLRVGAREMGARVGARVGVFVEHCSVAPDQPVAVAVPLHGDHTHEKVVYPLAEMARVPDVVPGAYAGIVNDREETIVSCPPCKVPPSWSITLNVTLAAPDAHTVGYA